MLDHLLLLLFNDSFFPVCPLILLARMFNDAGQLSLDWYLTLLLITWISRLLDSFLLDGLFVLTAQIASFDLQFELGANEVPEHEGEMDGRINAHDNNVSHTDRATSFRRGHEITEHEEHGEKDENGHLVEGLHVHRKVAFERLCPLINDDHKYARLHLDCDLSPKAILPEYERCAE